MRLMLAVMGLVVVAVVVARQLAWAPRTARVSAETLAHWARLRGQRGDLDDETAVW